MKIVSFNLRCVWNGAVDGKNSFVHRAGFIYEKITAERPDVLAFQEVVPQSLELLKRMLPEYEFYGSKRGEGFVGAEGLYTAFRKDKFSLVSGDIFWLSPTPSVMGSRFENQSECPRVCISVKLRNKKTSETLRVINVHLDHVSDEARKLGMRCLFDYAIDKNATDKQPTVILGDFNAVPTSETMKAAFAEDWLFEVSKIKKGTTWHDFGRVNHKIIDFVFVTEELQKRVKSSVLWKDKTNGIYLSDHYPVCVEFEEKKGV